MPMGLTVKAFGIPFCHCRTHIPPHPNHRPRLRPRCRAHPRARPLLRPHEAPPRLSVHERGRSGDHVTGLLLGAIEILSAYDSSAKIVKVYPISALGGSWYISALKRPFHHISMVVSQGITIGC
nr:hypothetical protein CFP56_45476 [Quercus suber]